MRTPSHDHMETRTIAHQLVHEYAQQHHIVIENKKAYTNLSTYEYNYWYAGIPSSTMASMYLDT
jgi:hypothetical protein